MKRKVKQILSFILAIAMVLTMGSVSNLGREVVKAADRVKLYFELPEGAQVTDWAVNVWGQSISVTGDTDHAFRPGTWGDGNTFPTLLADENLSGWGYVTVSGTVEGMQFVNAAGYEYKCWNSQIAKQNLTAAYFVPEADGKGVWYRESSRENEVKEAEVQNIFVLAGSEGLTGKNWSKDVSGNEKNILKQDAANASVYSVTYEDVPKGSYEYKILQDPDNKGWDLPWGNSENRKLELTVRSKVTLSIDLTDGKKDVKITNVPLEEEKEDPAGDKDPEYKKFIIHIKNDKNWKNANIQFGSGESWTPVKGFEDAKNNKFGVPVEKDAVNEGWFTYGAKLPGSVTEVNGLFNCGAWGTNNQCDNFKVDLATDRETWITFTDAANTKEIKTSYEAPQSWKNDLIVHFKNELNWETVNAKFGAGSSWNAIPGYEDYKNNAKGSEISADKENAGWYSYHVGLGKDITEVQGLFNNGSWGAGNQTANYSISGISGDKEVWITMSSTGASEVAAERPEGWNGKELLTVARTYSTDQEEEKIVSPVVKAPYVTFNLKDNGYDKVELRGTMNDWGKEVYALTKDEDGVWSISLKLTAGTYSYKFVTNGTNWMADPLNEEKDEYGNSTVTVPAYYTYNVYYYDANEEHMSVDAADMHVWEKDGKEIGDLKFSELVEIEGNQWLKGTIYTTATKLGIIPRSIGEWKWQTGDHYYDNTEKKLETNLYIVYGDDAKTYTEVPTIKELRKRNVVVEYNRPQEDYEGWNIFSWNTGFGSETQLYTQKLNGDYDIIVPVKDSDKAFDMAFCMRRSTKEEPWAEKDGGDHAITVPGDQIVVKAVFDQGKGVTRVLPYNKGYEMDGAKGKITFLYREDALLLDNTEDSLKGKVKVVVNGVTHDMNYDAENERYVYEMTGIKAGEYAYYYVVDGEEKIDAFNEKTTFLGNKECSVITYKKFENLGIAAKLQNDKMDDQANNVLSVSLTGKDASAITTDEIAGITMNLKGLGLGTTSIDKDLMKGVISVKTGVTSGVKKIPVTMTDIYGNVYTTTAKVTVTKNDEKGFDWDEAVIYFAVTDRFFDGSTANNKGVNKDGSLSYHGGDFAGLTQKLDYLKNLGVNTIWITPIVENSNTTTEKDGEEIESMGYHGYWASDFTKLNPHLGTEQEFSALIKEAHKRGMKLMVDVVLNHSGYKDETTGFDPEEYFNTILVDEKTSEKIPMIRDASNTVSGDDVYSSLAGLPDFVTEDARVRDQLIQWQVDWVDKFGIDFFRVDTVKHVDTETWQAFKNALTEVDPDFKMIGELSGHGYTSSQLGIGGMDSLLDFDFNDQAQNFVTGNISAVESFLANRNAGINNTRTVGAFLSSHDEDGLVYKLINQNSMTEEEALKAFKVAAALQLTAKGQAVIYYGEELGQYGADNYPYQTNRYDFDWNLAAKQAADKNSMLNHYKKLLSIRNANKKLLARGTRRAIVSSDEEGYDVFARTLGSKSMYVALNIKDAAKKVTFAVDAKAGSVLVDQYSNKEYVVSKNQTVTVTIPEAAKGGTVILSQKNENNNSQNNGNNNNNNNQNSNGSGSANGSVNNGSTNNAGSHGNSDKNNSGNGNSSAHKNGSASGSTSHAVANNPSKGSAAAVNQSGVSGTGTNNDADANDADAQSETTVEEDEDTTVEDDTAEQEEQKEEEETTAAEEKQDQKKADTQDTEAAIEAAKGNDSGFPIVPVAVGIVVLAGAAAAGGFFFMKKRSVK